MVKKVVFFICLCFCGLAILEAEPLVDASIARNSQAHFPLEGTITITHTKEEIIDPQSFILEGKPLNVSLVKDVKMSASSEIATWVSIYSFQLPAQKEGLYALPSIGVKIGGKTYASSPSSYEVQAEGASQSSSSQSISPPSSSPLIFRLEASVEGPTTLYPGERTKLMYRILYNRSVDLTHSELPMIHPDHFRKVGDVHIQDSQEQEMTVQSLTQEVEAAELGTFSFGPSLIEGYAYHMQAGQKVYDSTPLKAEAPLVKLEVKPFPSAAIQPPSFTGALGKIKVEASLKSSFSLAVGEVVHLQVAIAGITNLTELHLPLLTCQPGFSGFFQTSDIPPLSEVKEQIKFFYIELRPLTTLIDHIPPIEVSSFDPTTQQYIVQTTSSIPLKINAQPLEQLLPPPIPPLLTLLSPDEQWPIPSLPPLGLEDDRYFQFNLTFSWQKGKWVMWTSILVTLLLLLQKYAHKKWLARPRQPVSPSESLFKQALKTNDLSLLEQAFWHRLWEKRIVSQGVSQLEKVPREERWISLYAFLFKLQALQYSANKSFDPLLLHKEAQEEFRAI